MKIFLLAMITILAAASAYATSLDMSAGGGLGFSPVFRDYQTISGSTTNAVSYNPGYFDLDGFFDLTYIRFDAMFMISTGNPAYTFKTTTGNTSTSTTGVITNSDSFLDISAIAKYPVRIMPKVEVWPSGGLEYDIDLAPSTNVIQGATNNFSALWLKLGGGADIQVSGDLYFVPEVMFNLDLTPVSLTGSPDPSQATLADFISKYSYTESAYRFDINLGLSYRLKQQFKF